jgi:hypothetical protein
MTKQLKPACEFHQYGQTLMIRFKGERTQHKITFKEKEKRDEVKKLVELYNKQPNEMRKAKLIKLLTPKTEKAKTEMLVAKKVKQREVKEAKGELKETKKLIALESQSLATTEQFLGNDERLLMKDGEVYLRPYTQVAMPVDLVDEFKRAIIAGESERIEALINFWMLCLLNPNPIARTKLFRYLSKHNLVITPNGYIVTYRMVKKTNDPNVFTSARTGQEKYIMGEVYRMPRTECDEDGANDCSRGLHVGTPEFLGLNGLEKLGDGYKEKNSEYGRRPSGWGTGYGPADDDPRFKQQFSQSFGNQAVITLLNPAHVVSVPNSDTRKLRSCEIYFVKTTKVEEVVKLQTTDFALYDNQYKTLERAEIQKMLDNTKLEQFVSDDVQTNVKKMSAKRLKAYEERIHDLRSKMEVSKDPINKDLSLDQINAIIQKRLTS